MRKLLATLFIAFFIAGQLAPVALGAGPLQGVVQEKEVAPGVFGWINAFTTEPTFPSNPAQDEPLSDGSFVYDTSLEATITDGQSGQVTLAVSVEIFLWGQVTEYVNSTNGSKLPIQQTVKLNPTWDNGTVTAYAGTSGQVNVPLNHSGSIQDMYVTIGDATWHLTVESPPSSSLAAIYTVEGLEVFTLMIASATAILVLLSLAGGARLADKSGRTPDVPWWWPVLWIGTPAGAYLTDYVQFNQLEAGVPTLLIPLYIAIALLPYLGRFPRFTTAALLDIEGVILHNDRDVDNPKIQLYVLKKGKTWVRAPVTWWEFCLSHWKGLPPVTSKPETVLGTETEIAPKFMRVTNPLGNEKFGKQFKVKAEISGWFKAGDVCKLSFHHIEWHQNVSENVPVQGGPDDKTDEKGQTYRTVSKPKFRPHIVAGGLEIVLSDKAEVALEVFPEVVAAEQGARDRLANKLTAAKERGYSAHRAELESRAAVDEVIRTRHLTNAAKGQDEIRGSTERMRRLTSEKHTETTTVTIQGSDKKG